VHDYSEAGGLVTPGTRNPSGMQTARLPRSNGTRSASGGDGDVSNADVVGRYVARSFRTVTLIASISSVPGSPLHTVAGCFLVVPGVCCLSGQCFCPSRMHEHDEIHKGRGTPLPIRAESSTTCRGCTRSWRRCGFPVGSRSIESSHCPNAQGCADCARDQTPACERAGRRTALRGCTV
jgi:hypothetical protein